MDFLAALIPLTFGLVIGFVLALTLSNPRRGRPAPMPRPQRITDAPRPPKVVEAAVDDAPRRAELRRTTNELAAATRSIAALQEERKALVAEHQSALARRDKSVADHRAEIELREARLHDLREQLKAFGGAVDAAPNTAAAPAEAPDVRAEVERAQRAASAADQKVAEREQRLAGLQKELASVRDELSAVRKRSGELSRSVEELTPLFAERNRQIAQLQASLSQAQAELAKHPLAAPVTVDPVAAEKSANARMFAAYKHDMARQEDDKAALRRELAKRDARIRDLTVRLDGRADAPKDGRADVRVARAAKSGGPEAPAAPDGAPGGSLTQSPDESTVAEVVAETAQAVAPTRGGVPVKAAVPVKGDDLKVIKGIGPVYARLLDAAGIRTFTDLAGADPTQLAAAVTRGKAVPPDVMPWIDEARTFVDAR